ncbi:MAG: hypothetical protein LC803_15490 [Acidobacteria bacterium]|nr:hypothetical protein [Acidobacteriota bacterium]
MSDPNPLAEGDPPIIVQGGGSVSIIVPPNFSEQTISSYLQTGGGHGKDFKNDGVHLISLQIDEDTPIPLNKNAKITINYK